MGEIRYPGGNLFDRGDRCCRALACNPKGRDVRLLRHAPNRFPPVYPAVYLGFDRHLGSLPPDQQAVWLVEGRPIGCVIGERRIPTVVVAGGEVEAMVSHKF